MSAGDAKLSLCNPFGIVSKDARLSALTSKFGTICDLETQINTITRQVISNITNNNVSNTPIPPAETEPLPIQTRFLMVNFGGSDGPQANGTDERPFLTINKALSTITDAAPFLFTPVPPPLNPPQKLYVVILGPGEYPENFSLKANVFLAGQGTDASLVTLSGTVDINSPTWAAFPTPPGNLNTIQISGFSNLTIAGPSANFNFLTAGTDAGRLNFVNVNFGVTPVFTGRATFTNRVTIRDSQISSGLTQNGTNLILWGTFIRGGDLIINLTAGPADTQTRLVGGGISPGNVIINATPGTIPLIIFLLSFALGGNLIVNGNNPATPIVATVDSIPIRSKVNVQANTTFTLVNDAAGLGYTVFTPANWLAPPPTTVQQALDRLAAAVVALGGLP